MSKQARALQTYERVLDAAAAEFAQHGYPSTNLKNVVARTGLTKGALYGHFSSKDELAAVLVRQFDDVVTNLVSTSGASDAPALGKLRTLTCSLAEKLQSDIRISAALRLVVDEAQSSDQRPTALAELRKHALALVLQAQQEEDLDRHLAPELVADLLIAVLFSAHYMTPVAETKDLPSRVIDMWSVLDLALQGRPGADGSA
jgi:AcrR family transcriptional regulator